MRIILFSLLLASVAASPAMASRPVDEDGHPGRVERSEGNDKPRPDAPRQERSERPSFAGGEGAEQPRFEPREQPAPRMMTGDPGWQRRSADDSALHAGRDPRAGFQRGGAEENIDQVQQRFERRAQVIRETRGEDAGGRQWADPARHYDGGSRLQVSDIPRPGTQPQFRNDGRRTQPVQWDRHWRGDSRYDWQNQRRRHRSWFHVGIYYDPFGWGYQRFQPGWRLWPDYYSNRYWINDPWMYRLPYAPPGTRWIRYWDDALLVDVFTGQVIDAIPNFFW